MGSIEKNKGIYWRPTYYEDDKPQVLQFKIKPNFDFIILSS